jgi:hypothetical protein
MIPFDRSYARFCASTAEKQEEEVVRLLLNRYRLGHVKFGPFGSPRTHDGAEAAHARVFQ